MKYHHLVLTAIVGGSKPIWISILINGRMKRWLNIETGNYCHYSSKIEEVVNGNVAS